MFHMHTGRKTWHFYSRDLTYAIACGPGQDRSKDCCTLHTSLPFTDDSVSALGLWYKRAAKSSYKNCRFAAFLHCLRTADVLAHTQKNTVLRFYTTHHARHLAERGPGHEAMALQHCLNYTEGLSIFTVEIRTCTYIDKL